MNNSLTKSKAKNTQLSLFDTNSYKYKNDFLIVGNQKSIDRINEIEYLSRIFYQNLH